MYKIMFLSIVVDGGNLTSPANGQVSHTFGTTFGPTVVTQATTWWETVIALVKLQECGLGVHLPVKVCF